MPAGEWRFLVWLEAPATGHIHNHEQKGHSMKTSVTGLLQGRITRRNLLAAVLPAAGVSLAIGGEKPQEHGRFRLGGSWIAFDNNGLLLNQLMVPLDPAGKTAALFVTPISYGQGTADFVIMFGGDSLSDIAGSMKMTGRDTAESRGIYYVLHSGNPTAVKAVLEIRSQFQFTDTDTMMSEYTTYVYAPSADGLPHGQPIAGPIPGTLVTNKRVVLL